MLIVISQVAILMTFLQRDFCICYFFSDTPKDRILKPQVVCPAGKVLESVTLVGGIQSGYFRDHGKVKDMQKCRRICCEMPHCNLAFMLSSNCFSVACKSAGACKTQPANPSRYNPKISYVREYGSNDLLGRTFPFTKLHTGSAKCIPCRHIFEIFMPLNMLK